MPVLAVHPPVRGPLSVVLNPRRPRANAYAEEGRGKIVSLDALAKAEREITAWPGYAPTRLVRLTGLAKAAGLRDIYYKDEGSRFGLGSFKALGGAYAVLRLIEEEVERQTGTRSHSHALANGTHRDVTGALTVTCATDGNHGKSVAWGARTFGCRCVIYVHAQVSQTRRDAIAALGAEVREVKGTYDDAVRQAALDAARNGWHVVSDTSYAGYSEVPRDVMQGYALIAQEAAAQWPHGRAPTHVFVQGGVGALAASVCAWFWEHHGANSPMLVVSEPHTAACLQLSARAGKPTAAPGDLDTIMAGLACGEVSLLAWEILSAGADAFVTITDDAAEDTMRLLADVPFGDAPVVAGESAVAGLAGLLLAAQSTDARRQLQLASDSVVFVIGTEGATDPNLYRRIVGRSAEAVATATTAQEHPA